MASIVKEEDTRETLKYRLIKLTQQSILTQKENAELKVKVKVLQELLAANEKRTFDFLTNIFKEQLEKGVLGSSPLNGTIGKKQIESQELEPNNCSPSEAGYEKKYADIEKEKKFKVAYSLVTNKILNFESDSFKHVDLTKALNKNHCRSEQILKVLKDLHRNGFITSVKMDKVSRSGRPSSPSYRITDKFSKEFKKEFY